MNAMVPVPESSSLQLTEVAQASRLSFYTLSGVPMPDAESNFAKLNELFPFEPIADWAHAYLYAGHEHLLMWADFWAPFKFHPDHKVQLALRPSYTLARAALESAAQAVWLLSAPGPRECIRRHLSLMRWDLQEHRKSKADEVGKAAVRAREEELLLRVSKEFPEDQIRPPGSYLRVIKDACEPADLDVEPDEVERLWRAASGAAHGKNWPRRELQTTAPGSIGSSQRELLFPDTQGIADVLSTAAKMTTYGTLRYAEYAGADIPVLIDAARDRLAEEIPLRPGATRPSALREERS